MSDSDTCAGTLRAERRRRGILARLWDSYADDLAEELRLFVEGRSSHDEVQAAMDYLLVRLEATRPDGRLAAVMDKTEAVIIERILRDIEQAEPKETE